MPELTAAVAVLLDAAIAARVTPGAIVEAGSLGGPSRTVVAGHLTYDATAPPVTPETIYDLASLTKVIATTTVAMRLADGGALDLDRPVAALLPAWRGAERAAVTVRDLLLHRSGLPAWRPYYQRIAPDATAPVGREARARALQAYVDAIAAEPLAQAPRTAAVYSDLGFIVLGAILERAGGAPLDRQFDAFRDAALGAVPLRFGSDPAWLPRVAPTERDGWRGRLLRGEVHDENAYALGGVAGHAGLFGTAGAVAAFAQVMLGLWTRRTTREPGITAPTALAFTSADASFSSRALGWDTMRPTSSCGAHFSRSAVGHTGFTGTSLWIDRERDLYVVLLTNRVHPTRDGVGIQALRRAVHDAVAVGWHSAG